METVIRFTIKKLKAGGYVAISSDVQGLVAQGRTMSEALETAQDVAKKALESMEERSLKRLPRRRAPKEVSAAIPVMVNR